MIGFAGKHEPIEPVRRQGEQVRQFADRRERGAGVELNWDAPCELAQVELHRLRAARDVRDAQQRLAAIFAQVVRGFEASFDSDREGTWSRFAVRGSRSAVGLF